MAPEPAVFLVDDDPAVRDSLRLLLKSVGLSLQAYGSALEFLEAYEDGGPGCLILDVRLPGMGGLELLEHLARRGTRLPVIMMTGHGDVPMAVRAMKGGAVDFLEKPVNGQMLLECVQRALALDGETRQRKEAKNELAARMELLTPREREVLELIVSGKHSRRIASDLGISRKTFDIHRARVMKKMEAESVADLVRMVLLDRGQQVPAATE